ncbi:site-specific integrase [Leekyejoonella antrihumi]|uniref:Integrase n=1 Tax=Leekyejoonella antrihumi TaxID=1660198 RepID=A0A563DR22_9MICO|nr:site-specific integrase [Leekyejoonella antrihumi]TWP32697.1 integrase [Leekyejoonella antrihumi]
MRSCACDVLGDEWLLYWTARDVAVPHGFLPLLDQWAGIDARERALSIEPGIPILIDPVGRIDPRPAHFLRRSRFAFLAEETKHAYAKDYRLFFSFLHERETYWDAADYKDIDDYESWRRRSVDNPRPIGGSKWARELAAFKLLYGWAVAVGHIDRSPVLTHTVRRHDGMVVEVANNRPKDVRASNVKWLTPRTYRLWRDVGLRGYTAAGLPQQGWRGRNDGRNSAFADLLFDSGLRLREGGCLLTLEVPHALEGQVYYEGTVAAAIAKRRERMFYVSAAALAGVSTYMATTRRAAIRRAQRRGRYDRLPGVRVVTRISRGRDCRVGWEDRLGRRGEEAVRLIGERGRRLLFIEGASGLEPLALWLTEGGVPMDYRSWEAVFRSANQRCARLGKPIVATPHVCRHSFALKMLVALHRALDQRFGLCREERDDLRKVYGDAFALVKDLLGHRSEQTTRETYLEPLNGIRLATMLEGGEDLDIVLARVAASNRRVMDLGEDEQ